MQGAACVVMAAVACGGEEDEPYEPMQCWDIETSVTMLLQTDLDLLLLVGNASTMAEEQASLHDLDVHLLVEQLATSFGGMPDLHAAVLSDDRAALLLPDSCPALTDGKQFISDVAVDPETGSREFNYSGELGDQLSCMAVVGTGGDEVARPLASLARALENQETGFRRPGVALAVAIVTDGEDASPDDVSAYVDRVEARAEPPAFAAVSVVSGGPDGCRRDGFTDAAPAPRLSAFADAFGSAGSEVSLCGDEPLLGGLVDALDGLSVGACLGDEVASPPDCRVSDVLRGGQQDQVEYPIPSCDDAPPPCFSIAADDLACPYTASHLRLTVDRSGEPPRPGSYAIARCNTGSECR